MRIDVAIERGAKRAFASAIEWPGWCRSGKDEAGALQALLEYGPRYAQVLKTAALGFEAPKSTAELKVVERLKGGTTTDFGSPGEAPKADKRPLEERERKRLERILKASWRAFDKAAETARGKDLATGPRGGGRDLEKMIAHVVGAEGSYLQRLGWDVAKTGWDGEDAKGPDIRREILKGMEAAAQGLTPKVGPRGGKRWSPRYFVRRCAWHLLDHAWEIEDRLV